MPLRRSPLSVAPDDVEPRRHLPEHAPAQAVVLVGVGAFGKRRNGTFFDCHHASVRNPIPRRPRPLDRALATAPVGAGDDLEQVTVGIAEVHAAAAVVVIDHTGPVNIGSAQ